MVCIWLTGMSVLWCTRLRQAALSVPGNANPEEGGALTGQADEQWRERVRGQGHVIWEEGNGRQIAMTAVLQRSAPAAAFQTCVGMSVTPVYVGDLTIILHACSTVQAAMLMVNVRLTKD